MCPLYVVASMGNDKNIVNGNQNKKQYLNQNGEKTVLGVVNGKTTKLSTMPENTKMAEVAEILELTKLPELSKNTKMIERQEIQNIEEIQKNTKVSELSRIPEFHSCVLFLPENTLTEETQNIKSQQNCKNQNLTTTINNNYRNKSEFVKSLQTQNNKYNTKPEFVKTLQNNFNQIETESVAFYGEKENNKNIKKENRKISVIKNWEERIEEEQKVEQQKFNKRRIKRGKSPPKYGRYSEFINSPNNSFSSSTTTLNINTPNNSVFSPVDILEEDEKRLRELLLKQLMPSFYREEQKFFNDYDDEEAPNATMETKVASGGQPKRVGKWTLSQLRQTDGIIPSQAGWNKGDSQKLMTNFGTPRNTTTKVRAECLADVPEEIALKSHGEVRLQSGTNRYASQKGMVGFGTGRDVCREGVFVSQDPADLEPLPEEKIRASDGIVRLQSGTNKFDSQKGMVSFGTNRRETTKMKDTKHPEYSHEVNIDQSEIPLQSGTNKFASQKGMTSFGTNRRETTKMLDTAHPEYSHESSIDQTSIPYQMGSNRYASQKGMTCFGQPRWEVLDPSISYQNRKSQGMVRLQSGTNRFASQAGMTGFGTPRNTTYEAESGELPYEDMKKSETIIPSQAGWNKGDSQKLMTGFGTPRDVKGKHLKRIWELEYPEEAEISLDRL